MCMCCPPHSNTLPVIIDRKGIYQTRGGRLVMIDTVDTETTPDYPNMAFKCKGYLITKTKSGRTKYIWNIWHLSGMFRVVGEHPNDIVRKHLPHPVY